MIKKWYYLIKMKLLYYKFKRLLIAQSILYEENEMRIAEIKAIIELDLAERKLSKEVNSEGE